MSVSPLAISRGSYVSDMSLSSPVFLRLQRLA
jgi:hypothetical protein